VTKSNASQSVLAQLSAELESLAAKAAESVVQVQAGPRRPATGLVVGDGRVVTTGLGTAGDTVRVRTADGRVHDANISGQDRRSDLVLLKVETLQAPPLALAAREIRAGELAAIVGRAWNGALRARLVTVTGTITVPEARAHTSVEQMHGLDVVPYPGFSGSALIAGDGQLLGLTTARAVRGAALALPAGELARLVAVIEQHGGIPRGYLGISSHTVLVPERQRAGRNEEAGLLVSGVGDGTPAEAAGLLVGDIVVGFGDAPVSDPESLLALLTGDRVGSSVPIDVLRAGGHQRVTITVGQRPTRQ
jgi:S1-C subfamily serine protease